MHAWLHCHEGARQGFERIDGVVQRDGLRVVVHSPARMPKNKPVDTSSTIAKNDQFGVIPRPMTVRSRKVN